VLHKRISLLVTLLFFFNAWTFAQRYKFEQYDLEDGLIQSQVTTITQDSKRRLWMTTLGGVSCFNGKQFTNFTKINGLSNNFTLAIATNGKSNVYVGSSKGLSKYDGRVFFHFPDDNTWISKIAMDKKGKPFTLKHGSLYEVSDSREHRLIISGDSLERVTALESDANGKIWTAIKGKGLYHLVNGKWKNFSAAENIKDLLITDILADQFYKDKVWLLTFQGIFILHNGKLSSPYPEITTKCRSIAQDNKGAVWIGTNKGAYQISPTRVIHFSSKNGFTDNIVNHIFKDAENNIWLGTDGSGLFRYTNNSYVTFDETQGIENRIVMAVAKGPKPGTLWLGTYGGLYEYSQHQKITKVNIPSRHEASQTVNFLYSDSRKNTWIGTPGGGLWLATGNQIKRIDQPGDHLAYNAITEDFFGNIWLSTDNGCFLYDPLTRKTTQITKNFGGSLLKIGRDSLISGTPEGALLIVNKKKNKILDIKALNGSGILCMLKDKDNVLFGTTDYGLIIWNQKTGKTRSINSRSGLGADHIYSLLKDTKGTIWVGTGKGISRLNASDYSVLKTNSEDNPLVECNQNAILQNDNNVWIGTTKGVLVFGISPPTEKKVKPYVFISGVNISSSYQKIKHTDTSQIFLPYSHNHININYTGIHLSNPNDLLYQYRLIGLDNKYSQPVGNSSMNFTAIPAGSYTFQVRAVTKAGLTSANTAAFSFEILPPYYQTTIFRFFAVLFVILFIMLAVYIILTLNERKRKFRLKIKLEEQFKIRKQTAEDFHDDLGNKLTRITVLSEVLSSMIDKEDEEKRNILHKISKNVDELYSGTKDILWSLNPKNDTLIQLLNHISEFGTEMFNDTTVSFSSAILVSKDSKLSLDMSRNILMIFKESINNILKHSNAKQVKFQAHISNNMLIITLQDDGSGFDVESAKNGHGMNNMYVRAKRIRAGFNIASDFTGTKVRLVINYFNPKRF